MSDATVRGRFLWHELLTTDLGAAAKFFSKVAPWTTQAWDQDPSYMMFVAKGGPIAGLTDLPAGARAKGEPPHWRTYIGTPDVDATVKQAAALGGKIVGAPVTMPTVGRVAQLQDPQGAFFAVYTPENTPRAESQVALGDFSWHELSTTDWRAAWAFYSALFGWVQTSSMDMGEMGVYQMFGRGGQPLGGLYNKAANQPGSASWLPYIRVADARESAVVIGKRGGHLVNGPMEVPGGDWITMGVDPQGGAFAVHSVKIADAAPAPAPATPPASAAAGTASTAARKKAPAAKAKTAKVAKPAKSATRRKVAKVARKATAVKAAKRTAPRAAKKTSRAKATRKAVRRVPRKATKKAARPVARKGTAKKSGRSARKTSRSSKRRR